MGYKQDYYYKLYGKKIVERFRSRAFDALGYEFFDESNNFGAPVVAKDFRLTAELPTFWEFVQFIIGTPKSDFDEHWLSPITYCSLCNIKYDYILHFENFHEEIQYVWKKLQVKTEWIGSLNETNQVSNLTQIYFQTLSNEDIKALFQIYKDDFRMLGYQFQIRNFTFS